MVTPRGGGITAKEELRKDLIPHGACAELATYATGIAVLISPVLGQTEAMEIADKLREAHNVESLIMVVRNNPKAEEDIAKIEKASGDLKALANMLMVTG